MFRKARTTEDLMNDKGFPYHIGQLMGAATMAAHWMQLQEDPTTKEMGEKLEEVVNWFFEGKEVKKRETS